MSLPTVLCTELGSSIEKKNPDYLVDLMKQHVDIVWVGDFKKNPELYKNKIVAVIVWYGMPKITKDLLESLPNLRVIANVGAGYNHIDTDLCASVNVKVTNTPAVLDDSCADMAMLLLMSAARNLQQEINFAHSPETTVFHQVEVAHNDIHHSHLGIVGMGGIGFKIAQRAKAFDMKIHYHNRKQRADEGEVNAVYHSTLDEMLPLCDFIVVCVSLNPQTKHMFSTKQFQLMKNTAVFSNVSRGGTVDTDALTHALECGEIKFAALDVTDPEPLPRDHKLLKMSNCIVTPHISSATLNTRKAMMKLALDNAVAASSSQPLLTEVPETIAVVMKS